MVRKRGTGAAGPKNPVDDTAQSIPADSPALPTASVPKEPTSNENLRERVEEAIGPALGPNADRDQIVERVVGFVQGEIFRGPLPHPRHLQAYEDACPGLADRIVAMAEEAHNRFENRLDKELEYEFTDRRLGMWLGFGALVVLVASGTVVIALGNTAVGGGLLGAAVIGTAIGTFVHGRRDEKAHTESEMREPSKANAPPSNTASTSRSWRRKFPFISE
jgi:uncharacterized membrane protein